MLLVVFFKSISLFSRAVAAYGANIHHTVTSLNVVACFHRDVKLIYVLLAEITKTIQTLSPQKVFKRLLFCKNSIFEREKTIFTETPVRTFNDVFAQLLCNF